MLITVSQMRICGLVYDTKVSTEAQKSTDTHSPATSSPKIVDSQASDPSLVDQHPPMRTVSAGQMMHGQDANTAADVDAHFVRADTEHLLGDTDHMPEQISLGSLLAQTPHSPGHRRPSESSMTSQAFPTWRAHRQDFYASKWFRSILIFIICSVITVALILYLFVSPPLESAIDDIFALAGVIILLLPTFLGEVAILFFVVIGGMRWSKVFQ